MPKMLATNREIDQNEDGEEEKDLGNFGSSRPGTRIIGHWALAQTLYNRNCQLSMAA